MEIQINNKSGNYLNVPVDVYLIYHPDDTHLQDDYPNGLGPYGPWTITGKGTVTVPSEAYTKERVTHEDGMEWIAKINGVEVGRGWGEGQSGLVVINTNELGTDPQASVSQSVIEYRSIRLIVTGFHAAQFDLYLNDLPVQVQIFRPSYWPELQFNATVTDGKLKGYILRVNGITGGGEHSSGYVDLSGHAADLRILITVKDLQFDAIPLSTERNDMAGGFENIISDGKNGGNGGGDGTTPPVVPPYEPGPEDERLTTGTALMYVAVIVAVFMLAVYLINRYTRPAPAPAPSGGTTNG